MVKIRVAETASDWREIRGLCVALQEHGRASDPRMPPGEGMADAYLGDLLRKCALYDGKVFVAETSDGVVGYLCVLAKVPCAEPADGLAEQSEVVDLVVSDRARSAGVGTALLASAQAHAAAAGSSHLRVTVFARNASAKTFYEKSGFEPHEIVYEKPLPAAFRPRQ